MRRLRFLRLLLPTALVLFVVLLGLAYRQRPAVHIPEGRGTDNARSAENVQHIAYSGADRTLEFVADRVQESTDGDFTLEVLRQLVLPREGRGPLIVSADRGDITGDAGSRMMHFESGVVIRDPEEGLELSIPILEVDEQAGQARSRGEVRVTGPTLHGSAAKLVYDLADRPSELFDLALQNADGARLTASRAALIDGLDDVELSGDVRAVRGEGEHFHAERLRVFRGPDDKIARMQAAEDVDGSVALPRGGLLGMRSDRVDVRWADDGKVSRLELIGAAELRQGASSLAAASITAQRPEPAGEDWTVKAAGTVYLQGRFADGPAWLRAERLEGRLDAHLRLRSARVDGEVRFDGPQTRAESSSAELRAIADRMQIRLVSSGARKARLARGATRVAAEIIVTDDRGQELLAERAVEATLLPVEGAGVPGPFHSDSAVHFVAARLEGHGSASRLIFSGGVRAWQGEQNLSAERVTLDQPAGRLVAEERVTTRVPRTPGGSTATESDFVHISAKRLDYDDPGRRAIFRDEVRVRLAEGWMEAGRMEIDFAEGQSGIDEIRAAGQVRIEFRDPATQGQPMMIAGNSDRLVYRPALATVWLHGDEAPATVRRIGAGEGTTSGRVLRYQLEQGTLDVESGGRIQTTGG